MILHVCASKQESHIVPEGVSSDRILRSQRNAAENDEKQDEISEDVVMDQDMATHSYSGERHKENCGQLCVVYMVQNSILLYFNYIYLPRCLRKQRHLYGHEYAVFETTHSLFNT